MQEWMSDKNLLVLHNHEQINYKLASSQYLYSPTALVSKEAIVKHIPLQFSQPSHLRFELLHTHL